MLTDNDIGDIGATVPAATELWKWLYRDILSRLMRL